jgi:hypothetical protein
MVAIVCRVRFKIVLALSQRCFNSHEKCTNFKTVKHLKTVEQHLKTVLSVSQGDTVYYLASKCKISLEICMQALECVVPVSKSRETCLNIVYHKHS